MGKIKNNTTSRIISFYIKDVNQSKLKILKFILQEFKNRIFKYFLSLKYSRSTKKTIKIYNKVWKEKNNEKWFSKENNITVHRYGFKFFLSSNGLTQRIWQQEMINKIHEISPKNVLEVGSGNGINLKILSSNFNMINFKGIDYSIEGIKRSNELKKSLLKDNIFRPLNINANLNSKNLDFIYANARSLPFSDKNFDLIFTILALEQMNNIVKEVLFEIKRCAARHIVLIEPFKELNNLGIKYLHHRANKYLDLDSNDFIDENYKLIEYKKKYPNKISLGVGLLHLERISK